MKFTLNYNNYNHKSRLYTYGLWLKDLPYVCVMDIKLRYYIPLEKISKALDFSSALLYNQVRKGIQIQNLMPSYD